MTCPYEESCSAAVLLTLHFASTQGSVLTPEEQKEISAMLCPWATHDMLMGRAKRPLKFVEDME